MRDARRRRWMGLATILDLRPQGFFIPHRYADKIEAPAAYDQADALFARHRAQFEAVLDSIDASSQALAAIAADAPAPAPRWNQDWFARLDAAAAYALISQGKPRLVVEIGSGHSTRFIRKALDGAGGGRLVCIDPAPRAALEGLDVDWRRAAIQQAAPALFAELVAGDVLFIDSSHILMPGSDVDHLLNRVLPTLAKGVRVHFHDIFLPDDYPAAWAWRGFNEQSAVLPLLLAGAYQPLFASRYVVTCMAERLQKCWAGRQPLPVGAWESSLWLTKA